jgi:hypothetical protein
VRVLPVLARNAAFTAAAFKILYGAVLYDMNVRQSTLLLLIVTNQLLVIVTSFVKPVCPGERPYEWKEGDYCFSVAKHFMPVNPDMAHIFMAGGGACKTSAENVGHNVFFCAVLPVKPTPPATQPPTAPRTLPPALVQPEPMATVAWWMDDTAGSKEPATGSLKKPPRGGKGGQGSEGSEGSALGQFLQEQEEGGGAAGGSADGVLAVTPASAVVAVTHRGSGGAKISSKTQQQSPVRKPTASRPANAPKPLPTPGAAGTGAAAAQWERAADAILRQLNAAVIRKDFHLMGRLNRKMKSVRAAAAAAAAAAITDERVETHSKAKIQSPPPTPPALTPTPRWSPGGSQRYIHKIEAIRNSLRVLHKDPTMQYTEDPKRMNFR